MTVASNSPRVVLACNGVTTDFPFPYLVLSSADLTVLETNTATQVGVEKLLTTDFTIVEMADPITGAYVGGLTVRANVAPANGKTWTIINDPDPTQLVDLTNGGALPVESQIEIPLDRLTILVQRVLDKINRSLRQPDSDAVQILTLPNAVDRANKFSAYDGTGAPIAAAGTSANLTPVSSYINGLLGAADAATARATLGALANLDSLLMILGSGDQTKQAAFEVDSITAGTTRTHFWTDEDANAGQPWGVQNLTLVATVAANALTVAVKTKNGTDPSATDPIIIKFRNAALTSGAYTTIAITAAMSLVISAGSTLDTVSGLLSRLYIGVANDLGTLRLFLYNPLTASLGLSGLSEGAFFSSTAEGGAGAADSAQVLYSTTAFVGRPIRLLGYVESTQAAAGTWVTAPSKIQLLHPGAKRTGDIVQIQRNVDSSAATGTTLMVLDDTIPQSNEGVQFMTQAIVPTSAVNLLVIDHQGYYASNNTDGGFQTALFQDAIANALAAQTQGRNGSANARASLNLRHMMRAGTIVSTTFKIRTGFTTGGTTTFNGTGGVRDLGGVLASYLSVEEIFV